MSAKVVFLNYVGKMFQISMRCCKSLNVKWMSILRTGYTLHIFYWWKCEWQQSSNRMGCLHYGLLVETVTQKLLNYFSNKEQKLIQKTKYECMSMSNMNHVWSLIVTENHVLIIGWRMLIWYNNAHCNDCWYHFLALIDAVANHSWAQKSPLYIASIVLHVLSCGWTT